MIVVALIACGQTTVPVDTTDTSPPTPYIYPDTDSPHATYDLDAIAAGVQQAVTQVITLAPDPLFSAYDQVMSGESGVCPYYYDDGAGNRYWYDQCTSDDGTTFSGYGYDSLYNDVYDASSGYTYDGRAIYAAATVSDASGDRLDLAGSAYELDAILDAQRYDTVVLQGTFKWNGSDAAGSWLADGVSPDVTMTAYHYDGTDGRYFLVDGGFSPMTGDMDAVSFDHVLAYNATMGSSCSLEPSGTISVRGADGSWYDVVFDGPTDTSGTVDDSVCDGCGTAYFQGEALGQACADFTAWLSWEDKPW